MKFIAASLGVVLACIALGYLPTIKLGGKNAVTPMLVGCGISLAASWIGAIPIVMTNRRKGKCSPSTIMAGTVLRFFLVLAAALSVALGGQLERTPLLLWVAISYVVLLIPDTFLALSFSRNMQLRD